MPDVLEMPYTPLYRAEGNEKKKQDCEKAKGACMSIAGALQLMCWWHLWLSDDGHYVRLRRLQAFEPPPG